MSNNVHPKQYPESLFPLPKYNFALPYLTRHLETSNPTNATDVLRDFIREQDQFNRDVDQAIRTLSNSFGVVEELMKDILASNETIATLSTSPNWDERRLAENITKVKKALGVLK